MDSGSYLGEENSGIPFYIWPSLPSWPALYTATCYATVSVKLPMAQLRIVLDHILSQ